VQGPGGTREVEAEALFIEDATRETSLGPADMIMSVMLPPLPANWRGLYLKGRERTAGDFPVVSVAAGYELLDGRMSNVRLVLGGVAMAPRRSRRAESLLEGQAPSEDIGAQAAEAALEGARPLGSNGFKLDLARALVGRTITRLGA